MRDYLEAIRSRVVVFDGGMGATLEQFDLTQEDYGGLPGKCHEALVLHRPDVIAGVHDSMVAAGAEIVETAQDILEVKAAIFGAREAFKRTGRAVPIQASVSLLPQGGKMLLGTDIASALTTLEALKVDAVGLNCSTGPEDMRDAIRYLGEFATVPVHCIPNAGLPLQGPDGETIFPEAPEQLSGILGEFVERYGVTIVGGCCGTTPEHIAAIRERCAAHAVGERPARTPVNVSSMMSATPLV